MLEVDVHILILRLMSSYSHVNNLMHIPANYICDSRTVLIDMTRDLCSILFKFFISLSKLSHELHMYCICVLYCICMIQWNIEFQ